MHRLLEQPPAYFPYSVICLFAQKEWVHHDLLMLREALACCQRFTAVLQQSTSSFPQVHFFSWLQDRFRFFFYFVVFSTIVEARLGWFSFHTLVSLHCIALRLLRAVISADLRRDRESAHGTQSFGINRAGANRCFKLSTRGYIAKYLAANILLIKWCFGITGFELVRFYCIFKSCWHDHLKAAWETCARAVNWLTNVCHILY